MALAIQAILLEPVVWTALLAGAGALLAAWGAVALRTELGAMLRGRRGEIALYTLGLIGALIALAYLSALYPVRFDLTQARLYSLSSPTVTMLRRLEKPVHIVFFHDPMMRETVELYELIAKQTRLVTVEFYDPMLNPPQARMLGVQFAGTAVMESEGRTLQVNGDSETDIANGILRVSRATTQPVCFLDGHGEPDPFSMESHDHLEGAPGHTHGLGAKYVLHERHGMAKARHALETVNYTVEKVLLLQRGDALAGCTVLVVGGAKIRSEEHTSELQSQSNLVCRLLLEKNKYSPMTADPIGCNPTQSRLPVRKPRDPSFVIAFCTLMTLNSLPPLNSSILRVDRTFSPPD